MNAKEAKELANSEEVKYINKYFGFVMEIILKHITNACKKGQTETFFAYSFPRRCYLFDDMNIIESFKMRKVVIGKEFSDKLVKQLRENFYTVDFGINYIKVSW